MFAADDAPAQAAGPEGLPEALAKNAMRWPIHPELESCRPPPARRPVSAHVLAGARLAVEGAVQECLRRPSAATKVASGR